jgi:hypothetical protein
MFVRALLLSLALVSSLHAGWKAGAARIKITPEKAMWMSGYSNRDKPAEGTLHDLWAKALAVEDDKSQRGILITMDLVGIPRDLSVDVCDAIRKKHSLSREAIILSVSHTHTGPVIRGNLDQMYGLDEKQKKLVAEYRDRLKKNLLAVADDAVKALAPAQLSWGNGESTFAVNRRNNKEADVPRLKELGELTGPVDHQAPVLKVTDSDGKVKAIVFGYACHATVLSFYKFSGDYPGFAQLDLEQRHPGAVALFWAGCGGDQNPLPRRTVELAQKYGNILADSVEAVLRKPMTLITGRLAMSYTEVDLPFGDLPSREKIVQDSMSENKYVVARAKILLEEINKKGSLRGNYPYPVQAWKIGDGPLLVTLGGEVVVDYSLRLKKELGKDTTWVMGYANDVMAYIPSARVLKEGGYEGGGAMVFYGLPAVWGGKVEEIIVKTVHEQVKKVR